MEDYEQMAPNNTKFGPPLGLVLGAYARGRCPILDFCLDASLSTLCSHSTSSPRVWSGEQILNELAKAVGEEGTRAILVRGRWW